MAAGGPAAKPPRVALLLVTVGDLSGSGGTERQFAGFFEFLRQQYPGCATLITAASSLRRLRAAGLLGSSAGIATLPLGERPARGRLGVLWMTLLLLWRTLGRGYDVVHICQPTPGYVPFAALVTHLPRALRPAVALTIVDCTLAPNLALGEPADPYEQQVLDAHRWYFRWTKLDGVYTWYRAFAELNSTRRLLPRGTIVAAARYCFTEPERFQPSAKEPLIVWAGRLSAQKRPLLFVDAVAALGARAPQLVAGWRFELYGRGPLEGEVEARVREHALGDLVRLTHTIDMAPVFARSRLFVSTQAYENFTSLAMLEAMAAGNAVLAEDVGQTREFVRPGENGVLARAATPEAFASALAEYLRSPGRYEDMAAASRRLATEVHTVRNFAGDIASFWQAVLEAGSPR
jgi:glycosyltransferase involved in cell wall biosynthesis